MHGPDDVNSTGESQGVEPGPFNPTDMFFTAACYHHSANILLRQAAEIFQIREGLGWKTFPIPSTFLPGVILEALAAEIYLKCLIVAETGIRRAPSGRHDHLALFNQLSPRMQESVRGHYERFCGSSRAQDLQFLASIPHLSEADLELESVMRSMSGVFENWRYYYEANRGPGGPFLVGRFIQSLQLAAIDLQPEWERLLEHL